MATTTLLSTVAGSTSNVATYAAAAGTPGTGKLIVVLAAVTGSTDAGDCTDNRSGTYTRIRTEHFGSGASSLYLFVRDALTSSASSHTVTVDVTGDNGTGAVVGCWYISGMSKVGSAAVRQTQGASNQTSGTTPTLTFASSCLTANTLLGCLVNATNPAAISAPTNWAAEDWDVGYSTPTSGSWGGHRDGGFTGTSVTIGNSASQWGAIIVELDTSSSTMTVAVGFGDETDAVVGVGRSKTKALGIATETDAALPITRGSVTTTVAVGFATETDTVPAALGRIKTKTLGVATETDTGVAVARIKTKVLGVATETDTGITVGRRKTKVLGVATETDTGVVLAKSKTKVLGFASETDTALPVAHPRTVVLGLATETDTGIGVGRRKTRTVGFATETDIGQPLAKSKTKALGRADETDTALPVTHPTRRVVGRVDETDTSPNPLVRIHQRTVGFPTETDTALGVTRKKTRALGIASETDTALHVTSPIHLGRADETDTAVGIAARKVKVIGVATEADIAQPVLRRHIGGLGVATETDEAVRLLIPQRIQLGVANESDFALDLSGGNLHDWLFTAPVTYDARYPSGVSRVDRLVHRTSGAPHHATVLIVDGKVVVAHKPTTALLTSAESVFEGAASYPIGGFTRAILEAAGYGEPWLRQEGP